MADKSGIEWTDATWNPSTGCDRVSPGCANCYAATLAPRLQAMAMEKAAKDGKTLTVADPYMRDGEPGTSGVGFGFQMHESRLSIPLRWARPRRVFVNSMSDLFHPEMDVAFLDRVFAVMALARQHTFQVLTKRPETMRAYLDLAMGRIADTIIRMRRERGDNDPVTPLAHVPLGHAWWPLANVWLGTSVENARWRTRIDELRETPAAVRFLSCEPLLGPLTPRGDWVTAEAAEVTAWNREARLSALDLAGIDWVIIGGESGPGARRMDPDWVRDIVREAQRQGAKPFVKQLGDVWSRANLGHPGHGGDIETFPADLRVREYPEARA